MEHSGTLARFLADWEVVHDFPTHWLQGRMGRMLVARTTQDDAAKVPLATRDSRDVSASPDHRLAHLETLYRLTDRLYRASGMEAILDAALDAIVEGLGCEKCSILLFDAAGVMRFVAWRGLSEHYRTTLEGHTPWPPGTREPPPIFVTDILDTGESDEVKQTITAEGIRGLAFIPITSQGQVIGKFMAYQPGVGDFAESCKALAVTIARQLGFSLEHARAERARLQALGELQESEQRFRLMAEHAPVMIWMCDAEGRCLHLNEMLRRFWNVGEGDLSGFDWRSTMHPGDIDRVMTAMGGALQRRQKVCVTGRYRNAEGTYRTLETVAHPRFGADGAFLGLTGVNTDTTDRERTEAQRELLLAELNHRVKNTLAVVQGLAHQTFRNTERPARHAFEGRLQALATAHDLLTRSHWETTSLAQLVSDTLRPAGANRTRIEAAGPPVRLSPHAALTIALALHELFTNTLKYGALSNDEGKVQLVWRHCESDGKLVIEWRERGGPPVVRPRQRGFGSLMLERTLARDLDGRVELAFEPEGVECRIEMPMSDPGGHACLG